MKKLTLITALLICLVICLNACTSYRDDVAARDIAPTALESLSTVGGFTALDELFLSLEFSNPELIESDVSDWVVYSSSSTTSVDEFGIFHVKADGDLDAVKAEVTAYVEATQVKLQVFLEKYEPAETTKLENAQVFVYGNYVVYTILLDEDTAAVKTAVQDALK